MMKYKIGVGINYWDDPKGLVRMLETPTFYDRVDQIYLIDGQYRGRNEKREFAENFAFHISQEYKKILYMRTNGWNQVEKRNQYWNMAELMDMDFMLFLDSDEFCQFDDRFDNTLDLCMKSRKQMFLVDMHIFKEEGDITVPFKRLFRKPFDFRHKNLPDKISHGFLYKPDGTEYNVAIDFENVNRDIGVNGILITHEKAYRSKKREREDESYYKKTPFR